MGEKTEQKPSIWNRHYDNAWSLEVLFKETPSQPHHVNGHQLSRPSSHSTLVWLSTLWSIVRREGRCVSGNLLPKRNAHAGIGWITYNNWWFLNYDKILRFSVPKISNRPGIITAGQWWTPIKHRPLTTTTTTFSSNQISQYILWLVVP